MVQHCFRRCVRGLLALAAVSLSLSATLSAGAAPWAGDRHRFASPRFERVWNNADRAVSQGRATRSWTWGPQPWFDYKEPYKQSPGGLRLVQYFDKARMEINDPASTAGPLNGVTNGLLVVEMVSGRIKLGDGIDDTENRQWGPADIPVAGDPPVNGGANPNTPTYMTFRPLATTDNSYRDQNKLGKRVGATLRRDGQIGYRQDLADHAGTEIVQYESLTGHNIPRVFEDFRNAGPIPAIAAFGHPISDPYWITARVGGHDKDVLVQLFERRTLTYTPSNPALFRVEMGNVGQHYFAWRYRQLGQPWAAADPQWPIVFARSDAGASFQTWVMDANGGTQRAASPASGGAIPYSFFRTWQDSPGGSPLIYGVNQAENGKQKIIQYQPGVSQATRYPLIRYDFNDWEPAISPDGKQMIFVSDRDGNPELFLVTEPIYGGNGSEYEQAEPNLRQLTNTSDCANGRPSWLPDGSGVVFQSNCETGKQQIYLAELSYTLEAGARVRLARQITPGAANVLRLTTTNSDELWPRVSPDGSTIVFFSTRDGNTEIYSMGRDGGRQTRLTSSPARDEAPSWSPDGGKIVFNSDRDGDHEIYVMNGDGSGIVQLTNNTVDDGYAVWTP